MQYIIKRVTIDGVTSQVVQQVATERWSRPPSVGRRALPSVDVSMTLSSDWSSMFELEDMAPSRQVTVFVFCAVFLAFSSARSYVNSDKTLEQKMREDVDLSQREVTTTSGYDSRRKNKQSPITLRGRNNLNAFNTVTR
ncbi:hypothetical protein J6590_064510 [Homalodisca vitripennis]|nr:hypothetical protein J6590_064510 [Homalodisca vitripennis]